MDINFIPIYYMERRHKEIKNLAQGHTINAEFWIQIQAAPFQSSEPPSSLISAISVPSNLACNPSLPSLLSLLHWVLILLSLPSAELLSFLSF